VLGNVTIKSPGTKKAPRFPGGLLCNCLAIGVRKVFATILKAPEGYRVTVSVAVRLVVPVRAVITLVLVAVCVSVVIVNVAVVAPAGTVTDAETLATVVVPLVSVTTTASVAGPVSVTVPVLLVPPFTDVGFSVNVETNRTGLTVIVADFATPR
jgi:hypothetical protein